MIAAGLVLIAAFLVAAGYVFGVRRARAREQALRTTLDERDEKLALVEHELLRRSNLDPVTGLPVQQSFQEFLEREWRRAARDRMPVSLVMIEVDHFRAYNDRMGKPQGDVCLRAVADALKTLIHRPGDFLARYGAGKFGVVLGGTDSKGALTLGIASVMPDREAAWQDIELIAVAERALAQANEAGRNRIVVEKAGTT